MHTLLKYAKMRQQAKFVTVTYSHKTDMHKLCMWFVCVQMFALLVDKYCNMIGSLTEQTRWAAELYATFLVPSAVNIVSFSRCRLQFVVDCMFLAESCDNHYISCTVCAMLLSWLRDIAAVFPVSWTKFGF